MNRTDADRLLPPDRLLHDEDQRADVADHEDELAARARAGRPQLGPLSSSVDASQASRWRRRSSSAEAEDPDLLRRSGLGEQLQQVPARTRASRRCAPWPRRRAPAPSGPRTSPGSRTAAGAAAPVARSRAAPSSRPAGARCPPRSRGTASPGTGRRPRCARARAGSAYSGFSRCSRPAEPPPSSISSASKAMQVQVAELEGDGPDEVADRDAGDPQHADQRTEHHRPGRVAGGRGVDERPWYPARTGEPERRREHQADERVRPPPVDPQRDADQVADEANPARHGSSPLPSPGAAPSSENRGRLQPEELRVAAAAGDELVVAPLLDDRAVVEHDRSGRPAARSRSGARSGSSWRRS